MIKIRKKEVKKMESEAVKLNRLLVQMPKQEREEYIIDVLEKMDKALDKALQAPEFQKQFMEDFKKNGYIVIGCILHSFEEIYKPYYAKLFSKLYRIL